MKTDTKEALGGRKKISATSSGIFDILTSFKNC